jgi:hypothetical protein
MGLAFKMLLIVATLSLSSVAARAREQEAGHYFPGGLSSIIDLLSENTGFSTFAYANESTYYHGSSNHLGLVSYELECNEPCKLFDLPVSISRAHLDFAGKS